MKKLKVASVQFNHHAGDKAYNFSTIKKFVYDAQTQGVELITFPEMCISGYWHLNTLERHEIEQQAEAVPNGPSSQALLELSRETGITIGAGLIEIDADGNLYNTFILAMSDGQITKHRKLHTFVSQYMSSGNEYTVVDTPHGWRVGILICWDNNLVENVRITALKGADLLLAPTRQAAAIREARTLWGSLTLNYGTTEIPTRRRSNRRCKAEKAESG